MRLTNQYQRFDSNCELSRHAVFNCYSISFTSQSTALNTCLHITMCEAFKRGYSYLVHVLKTAVLTLSNP